MKENSEVLAQQVESTVATEGDPKPTIELVTPNQGGDDTEVRPCNPVCLPNTTCWPCPPHQRPRP